MEPIKIKISQNFAITPGPRYIKEGEFSGELFRKQLLAPAIRQAIEEKRQLIVDLDGTKGYATSFLEESFGGLIREEKIPYKEIVHYLIIVSTEEDYLKEDIEHYLLDANENK